MVACSTAVPELSAIPIPATTRQVVQALRQHGYEVVVLPHGRACWVWEYLDYLAAMHSHPEADRYRRMRVCEGRYCWHFVGALDGQLLLAAYLGGRQVGGEWRFMSRSAALMTFKSIAPFFVQDEDRLEITPDGVVRFQSRLVAV